MASSHNFKLENGDTLRTTSVLTYWFLSLYLVSGVHNFQMNSIYKFSKFQILRFSGPHEKTLSGNPAHEHLSENGVGSISSYAAQVCIQLKLFGAMIIICISMIYVRPTCTTWNKVEVKRIICCNSSALRAIIRGGSTYGPNRHRPPFWQINHTNSAYFRLFLGYFGVISATPPPFGSRPPPPFFTYPGSAPDYSTNCKHYFFAWIETIMAE